MARSDPHSIFATYPQYTRHFQLFGLVCGTVSLLSTAFVSKSWHLIVTLGLIYPLSACTLSSRLLPSPPTGRSSHPPALYFPCLTLLYEWFNARRGLANGIMFSGAAAGGTFFPLLGQALLQGIGYKGTMLTLAGIFAVVDAVALVFIKRRIPVASRGTQRGRRVRPSLKVDYSFMKKPAVYLFSGFVVFTSLANFIPSLWMPSKWRLAVFPPCSAITPAHTPQPLPKSSARPTPPARPSSPSCTAPA